MNDIIEGEVETPDQEVATVSDNAVAVFNPLDAEPVAFAKHLAIRQENYDALQSHLMAMLVPGKDFGKIHVVSKNKCKDGARCTNAYHFSDNQLFSPGADKILGILSLGCVYPDIADYRKAILTGVRIEEILVDCHIFGHGEQVIAVGAGACERSEMKDNSLNLTIKRACKRARLDAVKRLPVISALFEGDFLDKVDKHAKGNKNNTVAGRQPKVKNIWDTGAVLEVCPVGTAIKGKPWHEIETAALQYLVAHMAGKPDILRAAEGELSKRASAADSLDTHPSAPTTDEDIQND